MPEVFSLVLRNRHVSNFQVDIWLGHGWRILFHLVQIRCLYLLAMGEILSGCFCHIEKNSVMAENIPLVFMWIFKLVDSPREKFHHWCEMEVETAYIFNTIVMYFIDISLLSFAFKLNALDKVICKNITFHFLLKLCLILKLFNEVNVN